MYQVTDQDRVYLRRCVELAREAAEAGDQPFGSVLVSAAGDILFEDRNRTKDGDQTRHPEFEIARWVAANVTPEERRSCVVYTSGEHCPMCSAAHAMVGLGRIVYVASGEQLRAWFREWGLTRTSPTSPLPINAVAPHIPVAGPDPELAEEMRAIHAKRWGVEA
ncbi:MAG TPA: nucleoside deaminase [Thermomicrobiales bacterium]|nr:nucleoside deaminase [Thermomicrobiales bacterium]